MPSTERYLWLAASERATIIAFSVPAYDLGSMWWRKD